MDRLSEMEAFATVVDQGGFTDAAKKLGLSKSAISKNVSNLEARLGARLLNEKHGGSAQQRLDWFTMTVPVRL